MESSKVFAFAPRQAGLLHRGAAASISDSLSNVRVILLREPVHDLKFACAFRTLKRKRRSDCCGVEFVEWLRGEDLNL
jgi:hypothetical protein